MKQKTVVDFLWNKVSNGEHLTPEDFEQAKEKEKQQIVDAANWGIDEAYDRINGGIGMAWHVSKTPEQYYNQTYNP